MKNQLVFGRVVVIQIARADVQLGGDQGGGNIGLAKAVEQRQRDLKDPLCCSPGRFFRHRVVSLANVFWE